MLADMHLCIFFVTDSPYIPQYRS